MFIKQYFYISILMVLGVSCSSSQLGWKQEPQGGEKADKYVEDFDPLTLEEDFEIIEDRTEDSGEKVKTETKSNEKDENIPLETEKVTLQGYRVQLLATRQEDLARKAKQKAIYKIQENVYLEFASPLWKIRVGDCKTRKEAEELREKVRRIGRREGESEWSNAWIVRSQIKVERKTER